MKGHYIFWHRGRQTNRLIVCIQCVWQFYKFYIIFYYKLTIIIIIIAVIVTINLCNNNFKKISLKECQK